MKLHLSILAAAFVAIVQPALAHGDKHEQKSASRAISTEETSFGREGDPKKASRTVNVDMSDQMRFSPAELTIKEGETVRFQVKNSGKVMHEMVLGTPKELKAHYAMMLKMPEMEHAEDNMVTVEPGKTGEIIWRFARARVVDFACLQPGHYGAGMKGQVRVTRASGAPSAPASGGHGQHQH